MKTILLNPEFIKNPQPFFAEWQKNGGVYFESSSNTKFIVSAKLGKAILQDHQTFPLVSPKNVSNNNSIQGKAFTNWMLFFESEKHLQTRRYFESTFRKSDLLELNSKIGLISEKISQTLPNEFDLFSDFALEISTRVICQLFGWENPNINLLKSIAKAGSAWTYLPKEASDFPKIKFAVDAFLQQLNKSVNEGQFTPNGLIAKFLKAECEINLSKEEIIYNILFFFLASVETSTSGITNAIWLLKNNPDQLEKFLSEEKQRSHYVDELLRVMPPISYIARKAKNDFSFENYNIQKGENIILLIEGMNTDNTVYSEPLELNFEREKGRNFTFGGGMHSCLGYYLAKMEIESAVCAFLNIHPVLNLVKTKFNPHVLE